MRRITGPEVMAITETPAGQPGRPRPWLLIALGVVVALFLLARIWTGNPAAPAGTPSNAARQPQGTGQQRIDPAQLDVQLEALHARREVDEESDRNPFRFQPRIAPASPVQDAPVFQPPADVGPPQPPADLGPPPIGQTVKFIGIVEPKPGDRVAAFSDCRITTYAREGDVILGRYRMVRLGVESAVVEYLDGRGRTTLRMQGQECVGR